MTTKKPDNFPSKMNWKKIYYRITMEIILLYKYIKNEEESDFQWIGIKAIITYRIELFGILI